MNKNQIWFLDRLKSHNEFGNNIKHIHRCDEQLLIDTFTKGILSLLDYYVLFEYDYYKDIGNGWNSPIFKRTDKQFNINLSQAMELYKFYYGGSRFKYCQYTNKYSIDNYNTYIFIGFIEFNIPLNKWFNNINEWSKEFIGGYKNE
jgi:hypothetical protein